MTKDEIISSLNRSVSRATTLVEADAACTLATRKARLLSDPGELDALFRELGAVIGAMADKFVPPPYRCPDMFDFSDEALEREIAELERGIEDYTARVRRWQGRRQSGREALDHSNQIDWLEDRIEKRAARVHKLRAFIADRARAGSRDANLRLCP